MGVKKFAIILIIVIAGVTTAFTKLSDHSEKLADKPSIDTESFEPIAVLELFTSQGCSSCPPADALLDDVKKNSENTVFALSYHVDYWNYIGWEDPFSSPNHTKRQQNYNLKLKSRSNYTPELVVNGKEHLVGSDAVKVYSAIQKYSKAVPENQIALENVKANGNSISFDFSILGDVKNKNLRAVLVLDKRTTEVKRGENRNRSLTNSNVVVGVKSIGIDGNDGKSFLSIPEIVNPEENISLILLAENDNLDITGAAKARIVR